LSISRDVIKMTNDMINLVENDCRGLLAGRRPTIGTDHKIPSLFETGGSGITLNVTHESDKPSA
jgi:hypothetical protein